MRFEEWQTLTLDNLYEFGSGLSKPRKEFGFGYPFLTFKEVFHNIFLPQTLNELVNSTEKEQVKCSIKKGDVFLTRTSEKLEELGMSSVALKNYDNATFNGFTKRLRPKQGTKDILIPEYVAFYFRSPKFRNQINSMATMTTRASLNNSMLQRLTIDIPPIDIQRQIIQILNSILQKEELNLKIISTIEELAQTLFKRWFVDFEFPNEEGKPYKSSGGKMIESELGMIPNGWEVKALSEIANFQNGLAMQKFRPGEGEDSLPVLKIKELRQGFTDYNSDLCSTNIKDSVKVYDGDVIFSWSATLLVKLWVGGNAGLNQHLFKVTSEEHSKWFYYLWTKHYLDLFNAIAQDKATTMGHIKRSHLDESKVIVPSEQHYIYFDSVFNRVIEQKINLLKENKSLIGLRDTLLPKLLSGEIELPDNMEVTDDVPIS